MTLAKACDQPRLDRHLPSLVPDLHAVLPGPGLAAASFHSHSPASILPVRWFASAQDLLCALSVLRL
jgi:hypothetical protein